VSRLAEIEKLIAALHDGGGRPVIEALVAIGPEAVEPVIRAWSGAPTRDVDEDFSEVVVRFGRDATLPLAAALARPSALGAFAYTLGQLHDPRALDALVAAVGGKDASMRWHAAHGLAFLGDPRAQPALLKRLRDRSENVRTAAIEALGVIGDAEALAAIRPFDDDTGRGIGVFAAKAVGQIESRLAKAGKR
jgi:HEAT repeat protein